MILSEKQIQKQITDYLSALQIPCWRQNVGVKDTRTNKEGIVKKCFYKFIYWVFPKSIWVKNKFIDLTFLDIAGINPKTGEFFTIEVKKKVKNHRLNSVKR